MATCSRNPKNNWGTFRYTNKNATENERNLMQSYWSELIGRFGTKVDYYTYNYSLTAHDYLYGEQPTANFSGPLPIIMMADLASESILLSKFGIQTDSDVTLVVTVEDYRNTFGPNAEPKAQDVIRLTEMGWDSGELPTYSPTSNACSAINAGEDPIKVHLCYGKSLEDMATLCYPASTDANGNPIDQDGNTMTWVRCPQLFEITERRHQDFTVNTNMLGGHYIWVLRGKRFDYSYQPGIAPECHMGDVGEETRTGLLSGGSQQQSPDKDYPGNATDESNNQIWDYDNGETARSDEAYGEY